MKNPIIVLTGPTASGKTALSFKLASQYGGEIICCDSMTVYRGMDIGTDKPTRLSDDTSRLEDGSYLIKGIRHHLLDIVNPDEEFNVSIFREKVKDIIAAIQARGQIPFLVGGSLLYLDSYIYDYQFPAVAPDPKLRGELEKETNEALFARLVELDPDAEWVVDPANRRRLIRALEICLVSGTPYTKNRSKKSLPGNVLYLAMKRDREELYARINKRVDEMMEEGLLDEVKTLKKEYPGAVAMEATGYRQLDSFLNQKVTLEEAVAETKKSHRNFAKRQLTWLRGNPDVLYIENEAEAETKINNFLDR